MQIIICFFNDLLFVCVCSKINNINIKQSKKNAFKIIQN